MKEKDHSKIELILELLKSFAIICVIVAVVGTIYTFVSDINSISEEITVKTIKIKSVMVTSQTEGRFALGCGSMNGVEYYVCYEEMEDGGIKLRKLKADRTILYPELGRNEKAYAEIEVNGWGIEEKIRLYIPENTIQTEYDLSLGQVKE